MVVLAAFHQGEEVVPQEEEAFLQEEVVEDPKVGVVGFLVVGANLLVEVEVLQEEEVIQLGV